MKLLLTSLFVALAVFPLSPVSAQMGSPLRPPGQPGAGMPGSGMPEGGLPGPLGAQSGSETLPERCAQALPDVAALVQQADLAGRDTSRARALLAEAQLAYRAGDERTCLMLVTQAHGEVMQAEADIPFPTPPQPDPRPPRAYRR